MINGTVVNELKETGDIVRQKHHIKIVLQSTEKRTEHDIMSVLQVP